MGKERRRLVALVEHLAGGHGLRDSLQLQLAQLAEAGRLATRQEAGHERATQNLTRLSPLAQPFCDYHRRPEVVVLLPMKRLTDV